MLLPLCRSIFAWSFWGNKTWSTNNFVGSDLKEKANFSYFLCCLLVMVQLCTPVTTNQFVVNNDTTSLQCCFLWMRILLSVWTFYFINPSSTTWWYTCMLQLHLGWLLHIHTSLLQLIHYPLQKVSCDYFLLLWSTLEVLSPSIYPMRWQLVNAPSLLFVLLVLLFPSFLDWIVSPKFNPYTLLNLNYINP